MKREDKLKALEIINDNGGTVETKPTINGFVKDDFLAITDCSGNTINRLLAVGFMLSMNEGRLFVNKL